MDQQSGDNGAGPGHDSVGVMEGTVIVLAEPRVLKNVKLRECVPVEEEEMAKSLIGFKDEVGMFERCRGDSGGEGHDCSWRMIVAFIPIFR